MNRYRIILPLLGVILLAGLVRWLAINPNRPQFKTLNPGFRVGAYDHLYYEFLAPRPFEGGRMWVSVGKGTNEFHYYFFDIEHRSVLGELHHASPVLTTQDGSRLLCVQRGPPPGNILLKLAVFLDHVTHGRVQFPHSSDDAETFWTLDLTRNSATYLGRLSQYPGAGTSFAPSPDLHYAYNKPSGSFQKPEFFVCDLWARKLKAISLDGWPEGWWDKEHIILKTPTHDHILYDLDSGTTTNFLSASRLAEFGVLWGVPELDASKANLFSTWDGKQDVFYLTDTRSRWLAETAYLVRLDRPEPVLKLVTNQFKFEWSDHFDPTGTYYLYSGRESGQGSSAVFLRDIRRGRTATLVPDDGRKEFSLPQFHRESIIYSRSNALWQMDFTGSNCHRLFPP